MIRMRKVKYVYSRSRELIDLEFYTLFDPQYLLSKASALYSADNDQEATQATMGEQATGTVGVQVDDHFFAALNQYSSTRNKVVTLRSHSVMQYNLVPSSSWYTESRHSPSTRSRSFASQSPSPTWPQFRQACRSNSEAGLVPVRAKA
jgi:hypothetical protein